MSKRFGIFHDLNGTPTRIHAELVFEQDTRNWDEGTPGSDTAAFHRAQGFAAGVNTRARRFPPTGPKAYVRELPNS